MEDMSSGSGALAAIGTIGTIVALAIGLLVIASTWKIFTKAGKPGWACLVPIYNLFVMLQIAGKPAWWFLLFIIPGVNLVAIILTGIALAKNFNKSAGFGIGLAFFGFIFGPILAFGDSRYVGATA